ncbi:MAG: hypothetical protein R2861_12140 [Desulfobacterales bacterium]
MPGLYFPHVSRSNGQRHHNCHDCLDTTGITLDSFDGKTIVRVGRMPSRLSEKAFRTVAHLYFHPSGTARQNPG